MNFIRNMSSNRANMSVVESVWHIMEEAFKEAIVDSNVDTQKNEKRKYFKFIRPTNYNQQNLMYCI
jgi:hypothetical protein